MSKRGPQSELTDRNWDNEEEPEDPGVFVQASKETIQQRVIKKAKRRGEEGGAKTGAFGGFAGFGKAPSLDASNTEEKSLAIKASSGSDSLHSKTNSSGGATSSVENVESSKTDSKENSAYLVGLKSLNECVLAWIKQHVDNNPYIILTPIFKDYEKYYANLQAKKQIASNGASSVFADHANAMKAGGQAFGATFSKVVPSDGADAKKGGQEEEKPASKPAAFSFGAVTSNGEGFKFSSSAPSSSGFTFGKTSTASSGFSFAQSSSASSAPATTTTTAASTGFSFGGKASTTSTTSGFGSSGFSFGALAAKTMAQGAESSSSQADGDEEYVPPKIEVKEIKEEGSLLSRRCKLFYQKEGGWTERGLGNIHLKPMDGNSNKTQILVRADTNLGNILLNISLTSGLPVSRQGKNNILLVCVPNPPLKGQEEETPIPMLIRVKSGEEADELLAKLEERKALL